MLQRLLRLFSNLSARVYSRLERKIPGFDKVVEKVQADAAARRAARLEKRKALKRSKYERRPVKVRNDQ